MRISLQKLLSKPSALASLRGMILSGTELQSICQHRGMRAMTTASALEEPDISLRVADECDRTSTWPSLTLKRATKNLLRRKGAYETAQKVRGPYAPWDESLWVPEKIEFESDLDNPVGAGGRLLDQAEHQNDWKLWACLFDYRQRRYGLKGVITFWNAIYTRAIPMPIHGTIGTRFWLAFVNLGYRDENYLEEMWKYMDSMETDNGLRWRHLYTTVISHLLCTGQSRDVLVWHHHLTKLFTPTDGAFVQMCRHVILQSGDIGLLMELCKKFPSCKLYARVMRSFYQKVDFYNAWNWHIFCINRNDLPGNEEDFLPLLKHLWIHDHARAELLESTINAIGIDIPTVLKFSTVHAVDNVSSRDDAEIDGMSLATPVTKYNDRLGARMCATTWVALDTVFQGLHALGVDMIGPLSLQAIALREPYCHSVACRIEQLQQLGISVGETRFSRSLVTFAKHGQTENFQSLLRSDLHPEEYDDWDLQERLLGHYLKTKDMIQYRRTLAILLVDSNCPAIQQFNIVLRGYIRNRDNEAIMSTVLEMQANRIPVKHGVILDLLSWVLRPRRSGQRPVNIRKHADDDLCKAINMLQAIMRCGSHVPASMWREIIRRLGMEGRLPELGALLETLAPWYDPHAHTPTSVHASTALTSTTQFKVPRHLSTSHRRQALSLLVPVSLQKAIVEWGFIHALQKIPGGRYHRRYIFHFTYGIKILQRLQKHGVELDSAAVRSAIFSRLIVLYSTTQWVSQRAQNQLARKHNTLTLEDMLRRIDYVVGEKVFANLDVEKAIMQHGRARARSNLRRMNKSMAKTASKYGVKYPS